MKKEHAIDSSAGPRARESKETQAFLLITSNLNNARSSENNSPFFPAIQHYVYVEFGISHTWRRDLKSDSPENLNQSFS